MEQATNPTVSDTYDWANHERRILVLENRVTTMHDTLTAVQKDTSEILSIMQGAKSSWGFVRKHMPKVLTFALGVAISRGWVTTENGQSFMSIFGF